MENNEHYVELDDEAPAPVLIPKDKLPKETMLGLIQAFVLQEGTDYGEAEFTLEQKIDQVMNQINVGEVVITFDFVTESASLMKAQQFEDLDKGSKHS